MKKNIGIVIPTFNEENNIVRLIKTINMIVKYKWFNYLIILLLYFYKLTTL